MQIYVRRDHLPRALTLYLHIRIVPHKRFLGSFPVGTLRVSGGQAPITDPSRDHQATFFAHTLLFLKNLHGIKKEMEDGIAEDQIERFVGESKAVGVAGLESAIANRLLLGKPGCNPDCLFVSIDTHYFPGSHGSCYIDRDATLAAANVEDIHPRLQVPFQLR